MAKNKYDSDIVGWYTKNGKRIPIRDKGGKKKKDAKLSGRMEREQALDRFSEMYAQTEHSQEEEDAKREYMMYSDDLNAYLRGGGFMHENKTLHTIQRSLKLQEDDLEVYRGVDGAVLGISPTDTLQDLKKRLVGTTFKDSAFLSTTLSKDVALEFSGRGSDDNYEALSPTVMCINAKGEFITLVNSGLAEVLILDRYTGLEITDIKKKGGVFYVYAKKAPDIKE